jgi:uncharacterized protein YbjT (DUF2867 family)
MDHFAGLDVSVKDTSVCIVDDVGRITREVKVASEPDALLAVLTNPAYHFKRIGLEAGPLSQWLFSALTILFHLASCSSGVIEFKMGTLIGFFQNVEFTFPSSSSALTYNLLLITLLVKNSSI